MSLAHTLDAGILERAAMQRNDESILVHIHERDCVVIEARYHRSCYLAYTKFLSQKPKVTGPTLYDRAFDKFCVEIIEKRIIKNNEVLLLSYLLKKFIICVKDIESIDVPYQATRLKKRIQDRYPQLVFQPSKTMTLGTLVYADSMTAGDVADIHQDMLAVESQSEDESDDDDVNDDDDGLNKSNVNVFEDEASVTRNLYFAALEVRKLLGESKGITSKWPPDSHDLTTALARESVPVKLYNFLAWSLRFLNCKRVDFVCDRYPRKSIKNLERDRRAVNGIQLIRIYSDHQKVPRQWKKFLSSGENKEEFSKFLFNSWRKADVGTLRGVNVFLTHEAKCYRFYQSNGLLSCSEVPQLCSDHEEADTRMVAHAKHASQLYSTIIIQSPDTDVFFIALNASTDIDADLFFETGVGKGRHTVSISRFRQHFGDQWCSSFLGLHAFTE